MLATFEVRRLRISGIGAGRVNFDPPDVSPTLPHSEFYNEDTMVTLTPVPNPGWVFKEWAGDKIGTANPTTILVDRDKMVTAIFEECLILGGSVLSRRTSSPSEGNLYTVKEGEQYEVGGTFRFEFDMGGSTPPSSICYEIQNMNSGTNVIGSGSGDSFSHTWADGDFSTYLGSTRIRFYCDANQNDQYDSGESCVFSPEFMVVRPEVIHFNVQCSDQINNPPNAGELLAEAQDLLLRRDHEKDWRAAVEYNLNTYTFYTPDPSSRPDELVSQSITANSQHNTVEIPNTTPTQYCHISIIKSFNDGGFPAEGGVTNPVLGTRFVVTMLLAGDVWAHETGHGSGIGAHYTDPDSKLKTVFVMYEFWGDVGPPRIDFNQSWLTKSHADYFN